MSNKPTEILTPVGRLVQGDCFEAQTTDAEGKPLLIKHGPNAGQPRVEYFFAVAVPKTAPEWQDVYARIHGTARAAFPSLFDQAGNCISPKFAFKVIDGDSQLPNTRGTKPCDREGFPGHWILNFSGGYAPKCYTAGGAELITDPTMLKRGYYVRVYGSVKGNGSQQQPGVFLNHSMVELVGYGEEIVSGPDGTAIFGAQPAGQLPAGASATPVAPSSAPLAQGAPTPQAPTPQAPAAAAPPPVAAPAPQAPAAAAPAPQAPAAAVQPAPDFLNGPAAAAPPEPKFLDSAGNPWTEAQLLQAGYTAEQVHALARA